MSIVLLNKKSAVVNIHNIKIGLRVRRGPDWRWDNQDCDRSGVPQAGSVIFTKSGTLYNVKGNYAWASVLWDNGRPYNYRIGQGDKLSKFDLIIDSNKQL